MMPPNPEPSLPSDDSSHSFAEAHHSSTSSSSNSDNSSDPQLSRLATLVGFTEPSAPSWQTPAMPTAWTTQNALTSETAHDPVTEQETTDDPYKVRTAQPIWSNPFAKAGLVGTGTLTIMVAAGIFLNGLWVPPHPQVGTPPSASLPKVNQDPLVASKSVGDLKTELALGRQAKELEEANAAIRTKSSALSTSPARTSTATAPSSISNASLPPEATGAAASPPSPPLISPAPPVGDRSSASDSTATSDPSKQWLALAKLGSYGQVSSSPNPVITPTPINPKPSNEINKVTAQITAIKPLAVGTSAIGILVTPLIWAGESGANRSVENRLVVQMVKPLMAADGTILFPEKTALLAQTQSISQSGLVQMSILKAVYIADGKQVEVNVPEGAIRVLGRGKQPLIANYYQKKGSQINLGLSILGGISKAAELYNRQQSSTVVSNSSSTIVSQQNPKPNAPAEFLAGTTQSLVQQLTQRSQQSIAELSQRSDTRYIAAGTEVEIFVNQPAEIFLP